MRSLVPLLAVAFAASLALTPALAQISEAQTPEAQTPEAPVEGMAPPGDGAFGEDVPTEESYGKAAVLDRLFASLKRSPTPAAAKGIERAIQSIWMRGETDTANLFVSWGLRAMGADEHDKAIRFFTSAIEHEPDFTEAWNKRATAYFAAEDFASSLEDIQVVLAMEPRHYGALAGLGLILRQMGNEAAALTAFQAALDVNPHLAMPARAVKELRPRVEGRGI